MYERTPEHCEAIAKAATERFANPENHPKWKGGTRSYYQSKAREIMGITDSHIHVHHIDGNWKNNAKENLVCLTKTEHEKIHNTSEKARKAVNMRWSKS
jgi:hypothetical protein